MLLRRILNPKKWNALWTLPSWFTVIGIVWTVCSFTHELVSICSSREAREKLLKPAGTQSRRRQVTPVWYFHRYNKTLLSCVGSAQRQLTLLLLLANDLPPLGAFVIRRDEERETLWEIKELYIVRHCTVFALSRCNGTCLTSRGQQRPCYEVL